MKCMIWHGNNPYKAYILLSSSIMSEMFFKNCGRANARPYESPKCDWTRAIAGFIFLLRLILKILRGFTSNVLEQNSSYGKVGTFYSLPVGNRVWSLKVLLVFNKTFYCNYLVGNVGERFLMMLCLRWLSAENNVKALAEKSGLIVLIVLKWQKQCIDFAMCPSGLVWKINSSAIFFAAHFNLYQPPILYRSVCWWAWSSFWLRISSTEARLSHCLRVFFFPLTRIFR